MRRFVLIAAIAGAGLSACAQETAEPDPEATQDVAEETALTIDAVAGTYEYTLADGATGIMAMVGDGTYSDAMAGEIIKGSWGVADDKVCLDPAGEAPDQQPACYTLSQPDADGVQVATGEDGSVVRIRKQAA